SSAIVGPCFVEPERFFTAVPSMRNRFRMSGNIRSSNRYELVEVIKQTMKTNHKQTYSYASRFTPLLRYLTTRNLAVAMFVTVALLGTTRGNEMEKAPLEKGNAKPGQLSRGSLVVYSGTDAFDDGDVLYYAHSSYAIFTTDGKLFKNVENHISRSDEIPEVVTLPVGSYVIEARSEKDGYVRVRVGIKAGRQTILDLDSRG